MTNDTIKSKWISYLEVVVPSNAGLYQVQETKQAFFAGAISAVGLLLDYARNDDEAFEAKMDLFTQEITEVTQEAMRAAKEQGL